MGDEFYKKTNEVREKIKNPVVKRPIDPLNFWIVFIVAVVAVIFFTLRTYL